MGEFGLRCVLLTCLSSVAFATPSVPLVAPPPPPSPAEAQKWSYEPSGMGYLMRAGAKTYDVLQVAGFAGRMRLAGGQRFAEPLPMFDGFTLHLSGRPWMSSTLTFTREIARGLWLDFGLQSTRTIGDVLGHDPDPPAFFHEALAWVALRF